VALAGSAPAAASGAVALSRASASAPAAAFAGDDIAVLQRSSAVAAAVRSLSIASPVAVSAVSEETPLQGECLVSIERRRQDMMWVAFVIDDEMGVAAAS